MPKFLFESCLTRISKIKLMFEYMFETGVYNMTINEDGTYRMDWIITFSSIIVILNSRPRIIVMWAQRQQKQQRQMHNHCRCHCFLNTVV